MERLVLGTSDHTSTLDPRMYRLLLSISVLVFKMQRFPLNNTASFSRKKTQTFVNGLNNKVAVATLFELQFFAHILPLQGIIN